MLKISQVTVLAWNIVKEFVWKISKSFRKLNRIILISCAYEDIDKPNSIVLA